METRCRSPRCLGRARGTAARGAADPEEPAVADPEPLCEGVPEDDPAASWLSWSRPARSPSWLRVTVARTRRGSSRRAPRPPPPRRRAAAFRSAPAGAPRRGSPPSTACLSAGCRPGTAEALRHPLPSLVETSKSPPRYFLLVRHHQRDVGVGVVVAVERGVLGGVRAEVTLRTRTEVDPWPPGPRRRGRPPNGAVAVIVDTDHLPGRREELHRPDRAVPLAVLVQLPAVGVADRGNGPLPSRATPPPAASRPRRHPVSPRRTGRGRTRPA